MKKFMILFAALALSASAVAQADVLMSRVEKNDLQITGVSYDANAKLGRAWINIELYDSSCAGGDSCSADSSERAKVEGLSLDRKLGAVVLVEKNAAPVVCARVVKHWYGKRLQATGLCGITRKVEVSKVVDDGYFTKEVKYLDLYFGKVEGRRGE
jgi:hypothetical protein